jgi:hypothetical protein
MSTIGKYRLIITDYFDALTSEIDLLIERELQVNSNDESKMSDLNKRRDVYLNEIKRVEIENINSLNREKNIDYLNTLDDELKLYRELFSVFSFTIEFKSLTRLITTNSYISTQQISLYKNLLKYANQDDEDDSNQKIDLENLFEHKLGVILFSYFYHYLIFWIFCLFLIILRFFRFFNWTLTCLWLMISLRGFLLMRI